MSLRFDLSAPRLIIHGISTERWSQRYGIEAFTHPCSECARPCTTTIPFAHGPIRGLQAPRCECGNEKTPYVVVAAEGDILDLVMRRACWEERNR